MRGVSGSIPKDTCHCLWAKATPASWARVGHGGSEEQRQVDVDELGVIPNLRAG